VERAEISQPSISSRDVYYVLITCEPDCIGIRESWFFGLFPRASRLAIGDLPTSEEFGTNRTERSLGNLYASGSKVDRPKLTHGPYLTLPSPRYTTQRIPTQEIEYERTTALSHVKRLLETCVSDESSSLGQTILTSSLSDASSLQLMRKEKVRKPILKCPPAYR